MQDSKGFLSKVIGSLRRATSEEKEKIDQELPFAVMVFALMATSGVSPYDSWKKLRNLAFLPYFRKEAEEVVRQVEVLGKDPLTVLHQRSEKTQSKLYRNFLGGFISSVRSGSKTADYLKSELKAIFEIRHNTLTRSVEKIATLVEAYTVMLIVVLCTYILFVVFSATNMMDMLSQSSISVSPIISYVVAFIFMPVLSLVFTLIAHNMQRSAFESLKDLYKKAAMIITPIGIAIIIFAFIPSIIEAVKPLGLPEIATIGLALASLGPAFNYRKISKINYNAEDSIPHFVRDVTESRKIGLSPEKSIIQATKRKTYGSFSKFLNLMRSQIEWGIPLRKTFSNLQREIRSWFVKLNIAMMVETIEIGGNSTQSLEILAEYSEKEREVQINRRSLLKPYILLALIWSSLVAVTTTIVSLTTGMMTSVVSSSLSSVTTMAMQNQLNLFSVGIIFQCWISGFFLGKISEGNIGAGFQYSTLLTITAYASLVLSQLLLSALFGIPTTS